MSGYKRVNFFELCRLCASNQQKEKTHIFQEQGRKMQLQTKIQSLLSLKVCENDDLPKVVCSQCLQSLEDCYSFRNECITSETMLSSYFNNFRYTEDFTKSGKVYIKDEPPARITFVNINETILKPETVQKPEHQEVNVVYLQEVKAVDNNKTSQLSFVNLKQPKPPHNEPISITANGEIVNMSPLIDLEGIMGGHMKKTKVQTQPKKPKLDKPVLLEDELLNFDIPQPMKMTHVKRCNNQIKSINTVEAAKNMNNQNVIINPSTVRNITVPISSINTETATPAYQNTYNTQKILESLNTAQKIVENINSHNCYFSNTPNFEHVNTDAMKSDNLNTISPNWADAITTPAQVDTTADPLKYLIKVDKSTKDPLKNFTCEMCKKSFKRREHLYQHVKLHTGFRPFTCENCHKSFMRKEHLLRHMTSHSGLKNFTCNICEKSFSRNDNLLKHKKTHDKESNFVCEICHKQFVMKHYYIAHKSTHDADIKGSMLWSVKA